MSTESDPLPDEVLAAELVLGLLDPVEQRAAERRRRDEPGFAVLCARWAEHGCSLLEGEEAEPEPGTWDAIAARLPGNDVAELARLHRAVGRWRVAALAAAVLAMGLGGLAWRQAVRPPAVRVVTRQVSAEPIVAVLTGERGRGVVSVSIDPASGRITVARRALDLGNSSAELWAIPVGATPRSLGLLPADASQHRVAAQPAWKVERGTTLAISLEPLGGSPTGQPTGPVILTGQI